MTQSNVPFFSYLKKTRMCHFLTSPWKETTSVRFAAKLWSVKRTSRATCADIMRWSHHQIRQIQLARRKSITAVFAGKCFPHSVLLIGICWYTAGRGLFLVSSVVKHSQPMQICIGIREHTDWKHQVTPNRKTKVFPSANNWAKRESGDWAMEIITVDKKWMCLAMEQTIIRIWRNSLQVNQFLVQYARRHSSMIFR